jgi:hypothetical protein
MRTVVPPTWRSTWGTFTESRLRDENQTNRSLPVKCAVAPFLGLAWLIAALLIHVQVSNRLAHQNCGLSGDPYVTLPNGYEVGSLNTYSGYVKAPEVKTGIPVSGPGYVHSIIKLNFDGTRFTGTQFDHETSSVRSFTFDTRTHVIQSSLVGPSSWEAANDEAQLGDQSYWKIYVLYRHYWPNYLLLAMIIGGEGTIALWVWKAWTQKTSLNFEEHQNALVP